MRSKKELRQEIRGLKSQYDNATLKREWADALLAKVEHSPQFKKAKVVLLYNSLPDEVETQRFIAKWEKNKTILLPVVVGEVLELRPYEGEGRMKAGPFGIMEPTGEVFTQLEKIEFVLVPGMAFDRRGRRLGRGKGYYDKLLPLLMNAYKMGVCYPFQLMDEIPTDSHDMNMDEVVQL